MKQKINNLLDLSKTTFDKIICLEGTDYDRRRKVTTKQKEEMIIMKKEGKTLKEIATIFNVTPYTVRYNIDPLYKIKANQRRNNYHRNPVPTTRYRNDRIEYKKRLIQNNESVIIRDK